jgi:hypothetical protein
MILVTHNIGVVRMMADRILVLQNGQAREYGETEAVLDHPKDPYTKKLMIIAYLSTIVAAGILLVGVRYILRFYALPQDTANLAVSMVSLHCVFDFFVCKYFHRPPHPITFHLYPIPRTVRSICGSLGFYIFNVDFPFCFKLCFCFVFTHGCHWCLVGYDC